MQNTNPLTARTTLLSHIRIKPEAKDSFACWQSKFHSAISASPGFVDLEIYSPSLPLQPDWVLVQSFDSTSHLGFWQQSLERASLMQQAEELADKKRGGFLREEIIDNSVGERGGVTQVFVTQVSPEKVDLFRAWMGKIHQEEAKAPGFRRVFVQAPKNDRQGSWITLLQFDTQENLDRWMVSEERKKVLKEADSFVNSFESHRVNSAFAGWFSSLKDKAPIPPVWKQAMLVLLVLFPIVMLEMKFLSPLTKGLNLSLGTFIGNAISVSIVSWPMMPMAIYLLYWWLNPNPRHRLVVTLGGILVVGALYSLEIAVLWFLF